MLVPAVKCKQSEACKSSAGKHLIQGIVVYSKQQEKKKLSYFGFRSDALHSLKTSPPFHVFV